MRGTKLTAWRLPPVWHDERENARAVPPGSRVPRAQEKMRRATREALEAIAADVSSGLRETVGIESRLSLGAARSSMTLELPAGTDAARIAAAIDAENLEAWCDADGRVHVAIAPWYATKDVDQTVLCATKVIHVMLGLHAAAETRPRSLKQRLLGSITEIMQIEQRVKKP